MSENASGWSRWSWGRGAPRLRAWHVLSALRLHVAGASWRAARQRCSLRLQSSESARESDLPVGRKSQQPSTHAKASLIAFADLVATVRFARTRSRYPILAPLGLLRLGAVELSVDVSDPFCELRAGHMPPQRAPTYLEVHFGRILEPFVRSRLAITRCEACEGHFRQHRSRLGVHLPLHVRVMDPSNNAGQRPSYCNLPSRLSTPLPCRCARRASLAR